MRSWACALMHPICMSLQQRLTDRSKERVARCCLSVKLEQKQTLKFYQPTKTRGFLKLTVALPTMIPGLKGAHYCFARQKSLHILHSVVTVCCTFHLQMQACKV